MDKYIGRLLDNRYEILEVIGVGGMAVVYKARCHRLNRLVAIKILKNDYLEDEDFRRRFHAESQAVAMLSHPNIVSVYDVSTSISLEADYIVMELIEGISLKQYMEKKGVLNWKETLHFAIQIAKALEHAHSRGIVHRDIKPHNVMVLKNGSVKVTDFGIARLMSKGDTLTKEALGSVHYISPEQAKGGRVDDRSDIYSLGVVMYEMMAGRPPYEGESPVAVAIQHINGGAVMPSTLNPNIPGGMEQIIMKAMAHDLADRYSSATQMLADMDEFRKNPAMLFDYNVPALDVVTQLQRSAPEGKNEKAEQARQMAQRSEARRNARKAEAEAAAAASAAARQQKAKRRRQSESSSRVAIAAIIACSLVILVAIAVVLILFLNGGLGGPHTKLVEVPYVIGKYEDALRAYPGLTFSPEIVYTYDDTYAEGQIIKQQPESGTMVAEGTQIYLTVSKGKETKPTLMQNLNGLTEAKAREVLNTFSLNLNVSAQTESSDTVTAGTVIRTEPEEGESLTPGQEVVLYVSKGKETKVIRMPALVDQQYDIVINILNTYGFPAPDVESVYSTEPNGTVIYQSVEKNEQISVDTVIKLKVSKGPEPTDPPAPTDPPTDPPTTPPTDPPTEAETTIPEVNKDVVITLDVFDDQNPFNVLVVRDGYEVMNQELPAGTQTITLYDETGSGTVVYTVTITTENVYEQTESVVFTQ